MPLFNALRVPCQRPYTPAALGLEGLIRAGVLGLLEAIQHYDPAQAARFQTYAACRMQEAMRAYGREWAGVPRAVREQALTQAYAALARQQGRPARDADVAAWLGLDLATLEAWLTQVRGVAGVSLATALAPDAEGNVRPALAPLAAAAPGPGERAEPPERTQHLAEAIDALPQQKRSSWLCITLRNSRCARWARSWRCQKRGLRSSGRKPCSSCRPRCRP